MQIDIPAPEYRKLIAFQVDARHRGTGMTFKRGEVYPVPLGLYEAFRSQDTQGAILDITPKQNLLPFPRLGLGTFSSPTVLRAAIRS